MIGISIGNTMPAGHARDLAQRAPAEDGRREATRSSAATRSRPAPRPRGPSIVAPVWRRKTSSRVGRATVTVRGLMPAARRALDDLDDRARAVGSVSSATLLEARAIAAGRARRAPPTRRRPSDESTATVTTSAPTSALSSSGRALGDHDRHGRRSPAGRTAGRPPRGSASSGTATTPDSLQAAELLPERRPRRGVDARRRLVEEQQLRPVDEPAGQVDPAAHAARVRSRTSRSAASSRSNSSSSSIAPLARCGAARARTAGHMARCSRPVEYFARGPPPGARSRSTGARPRASRETSWPATAARPGRRATAACRASAWSSSCPRRSGPSNPKASPSAISKRHATDRLEPRRRRSCAGPRR